MWLATGWDYADRWTVMGRLRQRQSQLIRERDSARQKFEQSNSSMSLVRAANSRQYLRDAISARWCGSYTVLALLFAFPDDPCMRTMAARRRYFDLRTGNTWDLFFPGYYASERGAFPYTPQVQVGAENGRSWYFDEFGFNEIREHVERGTNREWQYRGEGCELVLLNVYLQEQGDPIVDWESVQSGVLDGGGRNSLPAVIERISRDLEQDLEDASYGVGELVRPGSESEQTAIGTQIMIGALGDMLASSVKWGLGW